MLVLDDDIAVLELVEDALVKDGLSVEVTERPSHALAAAKKSKYDVVLTDVNLPEMDGFAFRDELRKIAAHASTPVVFLSAADETSELNIAKSLRNDRLLLKPLDIRELRRAIAVASGQVRADSGPMPAGLDRILADVAQFKETGILSCVAGTTLKRVVFQEGNVVFAASNDPREVIGQVFVRSGLISEKDLAAAFAHRDQSSSSAPIGVVLAALRKVTPDQAQKIFESKIRESLLDLFLWKGGVADYAAGGVAEGDKPFPLSLELTKLRIEGLKRRIKWSEVQRLLPDPGVRFDVARWPSGFPRNEGDRILVKHIEAGRTMAEIFVELRGQDFAVGSKLADMVKAGALKPRAGAGFTGGPAFDSVTIDLDEELATLEAQEHSSLVDTGDDDAEPASKATRMLPNPQPSPSTSYVHMHSGIKEHIDVGGKPVSEAPTVAMLTRALVLFRAGDLLGAREGLVEVLHLDPANPLARQRVQKVDAALAVEAAAQGLKPDLKIKLATPLEKLVGQAIAPNDAFVITRLAGGTTTIGDLLRICPLPEATVIDVVQRYLANGVIARA